MSIDQSDVDPTNPADLYKRVRAVWGDLNQMRKLQEECAELIADINRFYDHRIPAEKLAEEIADTAILIEQATSIVGEALVAKARTAKLNRLQGRVLSAEQATK